MFKELLLEIGCEEIPASWLPSLTRQLSDRFIARLDEARLGYRAPVQRFSTPRRLVVGLAEVAERQTDLKETVVGPPVTAGFNADGRPTPAALGFARQQGVGVERLTRVETPKGEYLAYLKLRQGSMARMVLPAVLAATLRDLAFPKQMHWDAWLDDGHGELAFGRPIRWIVFLHGGRVVPFTVLRSEGATARDVQPVKAGAVTYGHRFFSKQGKAGRPLRVRGLKDYRAVLASSFVLVDRDDRRQRLTRKLKKNAEGVGGRLAPVGQRSLLLHEVPDLVEYPSVVIGTFPSEFLALPDEVLTTTMIHHQHYFPIVDRQGRLKPNFLAVTNTPRDNVARIARNAGRVLVARLRDARFFWDADRQVRLVDRLERLDTLLFHKALGSYRAKADRVAELAERIARETFESSADAPHAGLAGRFCKADLATDMVGEFPELQGVMGGVYAREQGEPEEVWKAIYYHYLPVGIEADAPPSKRQLGKAAVSWAAVALADKLDTLVGLFHAGERPTGSRDPFGMRRQAQGLIRILVDLPELTGLQKRVSLGELLELAYHAHGWPGGHEAAERETQFMRERARYVLEERGFDIRNVRSVTHQASLDELRPLDARRKLEVLPEFTKSADFLRLATVFKRVKNIAKELPEDQFLLEEATAEPVEQFLTEPSERALLREMEKRRSVINSSVATGENYRRAFAEASKFGPAVDRFFTEVFVMVKDERLRSARLCLMKRLERLILKLGDVSEIVHESAP